MSEFSERIDDLLIKNQLKRADLSRATGIGESSIRQWIKGSVPSVEAAMKVAQYFDVSIEYLLTGEDEKPYETKLVLSDEEKELIEYFRKMPEIAKKALLTTAKSLSAPE